MYVCYWKNPFYYKQKMISGFLIIEIRHFSLSPFCGLSCQGTKQVMQFLQCYEFTLSTLSILISNKAHARQTRWELPVFKLINYDITLFVSLTRLYTTICISLSFINSSCCFAERHM